VLCDDAAADAAEAQAALVAVIGDADPVAAAGELAVAGIHGRRHAHHALLRFLVRRRDEVMAMAYTARREEWCDVREAPGAQISALRAVLVAPTDAAAALALLKEGYERLGGETAPATLRLSWAACAVACALHGAVAPELKDRLTALRRQHQAATPAVTALERGLALAPDVDAGLAEALPLLARG
jgi:hypothetical protein